MHTQAAGLRGATPEDGLAPEVDDQVHRVAGAAVSRPATRICSWPPASPLLIPVLRDWPPFARPGPLIWPLQYR
jgi:hypothetical protein